MAKDSVCHIEKRKKKRVEKEEVLIAGLAEGMKPIPATANVHGLLYFNHLCSAQF
jgi:hypothetical protein